MGSRRTVWVVSVVRREAQRRWALVAAAVAVVCLLPSVVAAWSAPNTTTDPARLRELILASAAQPYQGYADTFGAVALPDLPALGDVAALLGGSNRMRAWYASATRWRVAMLPAIGETDTYRTASGTYVWDFERNLLTFTIGEPPVRLPRAADLLPPDLARRLLRGPTGQVRTTGPSGTDAGSLSALPSQRVAGVNAAGLRLTPNDPDTTVGRVDVWADPATGLPLRVEVAGRDGRTIFTSRFLELAQRAPSADLLEPASPDSAGHTVTSGQDVATALNGIARVPLPAVLAGHPRLTAPGGVADVIGLGAYGAGLAMFVVVAVPGRTGSQTLQKLREGGGVPAVVADGEAYQINTSLLNALIVRSPGDRQRRRTYLLLGSVSPELLRRAGTELLTQGQASP